MSALGAALIELSRCLGLVQHRIALVSKRSDRRVLRLRHQVPSVGRECFGKAHRTNKLHWPMAFLDLENSCGSKHIDATCRLADRPWRSSRVPSQAPGWSGQWTPYATLIRRWAFQDSIKSSPAFWRDSKSHERTKLTR